MKRSLAITGLGLALSLTGVEAQAQLEINLDFTGFNAGPDAPFNTSTILNGGSLAEARAVMEHAATIWEDAFADSTSSLSWATGAGLLTQNISVGWESHGGATLATGGTGWSSSTTGQWTSGSLNWDQNSSTFFVDTTPGDSSEWGQYSERDMNLGGVDVNIERVSYDAPAGLARDNSDMLSVAIHEIGHALGWLGSYPLYDVGADNDIDITSGFFSGAEIPVDGGHTEISIANPGSGDFPYDPDGGSFSPFDYNPTIMSPSGFTGVRYGLTEADILVVAEYLEFDMATVNFNPVPEPSALAMLLVGGLLVTRRRRRA